MSINSNHRCDECNRLIYEGDDVYCVSCYSKLIENLDEAEKHIDRLKEEINGLKDEISDLHNEIDSFKNS